MAIATLADVKLHYEEAGSGDPPFVFLHGWCCNHRFFDPQFERFKSAHRVISLDLRGCGQSERPQSGYDIATLADDVVGLCRELGLSKPVLVGHSSGGMIGVEIAARHPSLEAAVVAVDPGPLAMKPSSSAFFESFIASLECPDGVAARRRYVDQLFLPGDGSERRRWITDTMCSVPLAVGVQLLRGIADWNGKGALRLCKSPLLVILANSNSGGSNEPRRLLKLKPDIGFGITVGAGHFNQLEAPDQVNAMIDRFVGVLPESTVYS